MTRRIRKLNFYFSKFKSIATRTIKDINHKYYVMRTKRAFKEFCVLGGLASSVCGVAQERPNIIVFLVDDMGLMDTSVPFLADESGQPVRHPLNDWYHTPNMERLAKQGICFSTFTHRA